MNINWRFKNVLKIAKKLEIYLFKKSPRLNQKTKLKFINY